MSDLGARELISREGGGHTSWPSDPLLRETIDLRSGLLNPLVKVLRSPVRTMKVFSFLWVHGLEHNVCRWLLFCYITELSHSNPLLYLVTPFLY
jgi:hypothetical protein